MNTINKQISNLKNTQKGKRNCSTDGSKTKRSHNWIFTWNNFHKYEKLKFTKLGIPAKEQAIYFIQERAKAQGWNYVFQIEGYGKHDTPHLQGYIESPSLMAREEFGLPSQVHFQVRKGNRIQNIKYCTKIEERKWRTKPFCSPAFESLLQEDTRIILPEDFFPWQKMVFDVINGPRCNRTIHWVFDLLGNTGKTEFVRHMSTFHGAITVKGTAADIAYKVVDKINKTGRNPEIIVVDIPRKLDKPLSYQGIEELKSGKFDSTKYAGGDANYNPPHFWLFANWEPDTSAFSPDRLVVHELCSETREFEDHQVFGMSKPPADLSAEFLKHLWPVAVDLKPRKSATPKKS